MNDSQNGFPISADDFAATITRVLMARGATLEVALLVVCKQVQFEWVESTSWQHTTGIWRLIVPITIRVYAPLTESERNSSSSKIESVANEILLGDSSNSISYVNIIPAIEEAGDFREQAIHWLNGEGVNNQGRVRSDNIASREYDGLLFRSQPEIYMYQALKRIGVTFAPLPVFLRGGENYRRVEPDFLIWQDGILLLLEIDGDTIHKETPAEASERTSLFEDEGAFIKRLSASRCDTMEKANFCATKLMGHIKKRKDQR